MCKYNFNFKMKVVKSYLDGEGGLRSIANQYSIGSETQVRIWINAYKTLGEDGLKRKKKKTKNLLYCTVQVRCYKLYVNN